jgi:putative acyl-CoA dehydrogenase
LAVHLPRTELTTHTVTNQVPPLEDDNLFANDQIVQEALARGGAAWAAEGALAFGESLGSAEVREAGRLANRNPPELRVFDRSGHRIDEVVFHPAYHQMMRLGMEAGVHAIAWTHQGSGGHVAHTALEYLLTQVEAGVCCPLTMTYAVVPSLRHQPGLADVWVPRVTQHAYDPASKPAADKLSATMGMAMTEKQGGSDVRANTTRARPVGRPGPGEPHLLRGHKWFCSAPMCDAFLTLAYTEGGLSCFLVPRWLPDGTRNPFHLQRLKDKLGNKSNASSELEYHDTWGWMVGEEGRGVRTIIEMVGHTRLDCVTSAAGIGRQALVQAIHHASHRKAFGKTLIDQPLMRNVLADLALEVEASTVLAMRIARAYDEGEYDPRAAAFARLTVAAAKYWTNKRLPVLVVEAMECLGGAGYIEENDLARMYREAPLAGIWEGSGNVICLDVLRAVSREPEALEAVFDELREIRGADARLDRAIRALETGFSDHDHLQWRARRLTEQLAVALQASLLVQHAPQAVADAFCATRLDEDWGRAFGTLPTGVDTRVILSRAWPGAT